MGGTPHPQRRLQFGDPGGIGKANADKEARFGDAIRHEGLLSRMHPIDAFNGASGEARDKCLDVARASGPSWFREPWPLVLPQDNGLPPVMLLIDNQGAIHDGGIYDDPSDDTEWDRLSWANTVRTWNVDFFRDNPLAKLYTTVETAAGKVGETAGKVAEGAHEAARGLVTILKWAPYRSQSGASRQAIGVDSGSWQGKSLIMVAKTSQRFHGSASAVLRNHGCRFRCAARRIARVAALSEIKVRIQ